MTAPATLTPYQAERMARALVRQGLAEKVRLVQVGEVERGWSIDTVFEDGGDPYNLNQIVEKYEQEPAPLYRLEVLS